MKKLIYMMVYLIMASQLTDCKKKEDDDDSTTTPPPPVNTLCDGKGGSSWMPLDSTNTWEFDYNLSAGYPILVAKGTSTHSGKTYRVIEDASNLMYTSDYEVREDASTHDLYKYSDGSGQEYLEVPGSPSVNQVWPINSGKSRKITSVNATLSTSSCNYTGLLEMQELDASLTLVYTYYFKKGLGMVKKEGVGTFASIYTLDDVTLK